jgi:hypothetical protein
VDFGILYKARLDGFDQSILYQCASKYAGATVITFIDPICDDALMFHVAKGPSHAILHA